jgi:hypothetical protein
MLDIPPPERFFLETAPYAEFSVGSWNFRQVLNTQFFKGTLDAYCLECGKQTVFESSAEELCTWDGPGQNSRPVSIQEIFDKNLNQLIWRGRQISRQNLEKLASDDGAFTVTFNCTRNTAHRLFFFFRVHKEKISKVGQSPSLADLQKTDIEKYRKVLGEAKSREFQRAIGLYAHGVAIGAFVYLRRIFEHLIGKAHDAAAKEATWDEATYQNVRIDEKILRLKERLPQFLVENRTIYGILSKGIHELSEEECQEFFEPIKVGIELILDQQLEREERDKKIASTQQSLASIKGKIAKA